MVSAERYNSGGTRVRLDGGDVAVCRGDDLFGAEKFDLIKIDVEGMEVEVLAGLAQTIARGRPLIFVEVQDENRERFAAIVQQWHFAVAWQNQMYPGITNFLVTPPAQVGAPATDTVQLRRLAWHAARVGRSTTRWLPAMPSLEARVRRLLGEDARP